jgi:hypothetical protein
MDQASIPPPPAPAQPIETPAERRRQALMLKLQKLNLVGYDTVEIQQKIDRIVNFVLEIQSPILFEQMMVSDILRHQLILLARILPHWKSLPVQRLPQGFFSVDIFMGEYLIEFLDRTSNIVVSQVDKVKCVLKFLICRQQPTINLSKSNIHFILELMHYFPATAHEDILPQILPILKSLQSPDHVFGLTLFQRICQDSNVQNLPNLVANLGTLGSARISRMKGSALAEFLVFLSNWSLPESSLNNISDLLITMSEERVKFFTKVLGKLTDDSSIDLILNKTSELVKRVSNESLIFCSKVVDRLPDQSSLESFLNNGHYLLKTISGESLKFCSKVVDRLPDQSSLESFLNNGSYLLKTISGESLNLFEEIVKKTKDQWSMLLFLNKISKLTESMSKSCLAFCSMVVKKLEDHSSVEYFLSKISDTLMPMPNTQLEFCSQVLIKLVDNPVSSVKLFLSAIYQKPYFSANLKFVSITADIFLMMDAIYNSITEKDFLVAGSNKLTIDALAKAALSLSEETLSDFSEILVELTAINARVVAARALLLTQLQFMGVFEKPVLKMLKLEEFDYDAEVFELPFVEELGLLNIKASHATGKNKIHFFNRCHKLKDTLNKAMKLKRGSTRIIKPNLIQGSPGVGKTLATAAWCQFKAWESSVAWITIRRNYLRFVVMREGYIFVLADMTRQPIFDPISFISENNFCTITAIDGVSKHQGAELMDALCAWAELKPRIRQAIGICSLQYTDKSLPTYIMPPWELKEFLKAVSNNDIWNQFITVFLECDAFKSQFSNILIARSSKQAKSAKLLDSMKSADLKLRESIIIWKYEYAGISSRFMFEMTVKDIANMVDTALTTLENLEFTGYRSEIAVNTLSYEKEGEGHAFSSEFILQKYGERVDKFNDAMDQVLKRAIPAARGQYFEYTYLRISKRKGDYKIRIHRHSVGNQAGPARTLKSTGYLEFCSVEPPWYELSDYIKYKVLNSTNIPSFASFDDFATKFLGVTTKVTSWTDINTKVSTKRKLSISIEQNNEFHEKMGNSYQLNKRNFVRYMDLQQASHTWLIPKSLQEPVIDAIYVINRTEVWLVQFTVADRHEIKEHLLLRAVYLMQDIFGDDVIIRFVFIIPTGQTKVSFPENILTENGLSFMVGETVKE